MASTEVTEVFVCTSGTYSDYGIDSVWLTLEEAQASGSEQIEVWPIGAAKRMHGSFYRSATVDYRTGRVTEETTDDYSHGYVGRPSQCDVYCWPDGPASNAGKLGIRITQDSRERADKVYSETRARVLAEISTGLPIEMIATMQYTPNARENWAQTVRVTGGQS